MRSRRSLIFRLTLCLVLGAVTTWLVAWGLESSSKMAWWRQLERSHRLEFAIRKPFLIKRSKRVYAASTVEVWSLTRIDREDSDNKRARRDVVDWAGVSDGSVAPLPPAGPSVNDGIYIPDWISEPVDIYRRDELAMEALDGPLATLLSDDTTTSFLRLSAGWPWRSLRHVEVADTARMAWVPHWALTIEQIQSPIDTGGAPMVLALPLIPIWPGLLLDTGFYGALWALPLFSLPLLRTHRRRRKGRCPRCGYDLKHAFEPGCPECGWGRSGGD
jgi:hypothetical protein